MLAALRRLYAERYESNGSALARALGMSQPALSNLFSGKNRPGFPTAMAAAKLMGVPWQNLVEGEGPVSTAGRYPRKARVLEVLGAYLPPPVREIVETARFEGDEPTELEWVRFVLRHLDEHASRIRATG